MGLTPEQVEVIKATVPVVKEHGNTITTTFYKTMLEENPDLNNIFNTTNQINGHQPAALANALYAYAANIDNLGVLSAFVERVCQKHASLFIAREHYDIVGKYLLEAMGRILGDAFTPQIQDAWAAAYWQLAEIMAGREEQLYKESDEWTDWRDFKIARKVPESSVITSFYLEPVDGKSLPSFLPGQYISVKMSVPDLKYDQCRQYSLSDRPGLPYYRISVKREEGLDPADPSARAHPGYISNILHKTKHEGDIIQVSHPFGDFFLQQHPSPTATESLPPVVLISAGVGLTPLISITNHLTSTPSSSQRRVHFIHATRSTSHLPFLPHLQSLSSSSFRYTIFNKSSSPSSSHNHQISSRLNLLTTLPDPRADLFLDNPQTEYYVCGPEPFMIEMRDQLTKGHGVEGSRVFLELFGTGGVH